MGIGHDLLAQGSVPRLRPPVLGEGKEELLIARETVLHGRCNGSHRAVIAIVGRRDASHVGNVL